MAEQREQEPGWHSQVCRAQGAEMSICLKCSPCSISCQLLFFFTSSSQNSYLLEQASCQDVTTETFAPAPGCDSCSTSMLGKSHPLSCRKHNLGCTGNNLLWLTSSSETLQSAPLCSSPCPGIKSKLISIPFFSSKLLGDAFPSTAPSVIVTLKQCSNS